MSKVPSLDYHAVVRALRRAGWVVVRQRGSHIRLQKTTPAETLTELQKVEDCRIGSCNQLKSLSPISEFRRISDFLQDHQTLKLIVPAHRPIKRSTLSHILKQAKLTVDELNQLL